MARLGLGSLAAIRADSEFNFPFSSEISSRRVLIAVSTEGKVVGKQVK